MNCETCEVKILAQGKKGTVEPGVILEKRCTNGCPFLVGTTCGNCTWMHYVGDGLYCINYSMDVEKNRDGCGDWRLK